MDYPVIDRGICGYCGACVSVCPSSAIELVDIYVKMDRTLCTGCLACVKVCPLGAMKVKRVQEFKGSRFKGLGDAANLMEGDTPHAQSSILGTGHSLNPSTFQPFNSSTLKPLNYDVLVIGGGPAGSIAARTAAQRNLDVLMIEKRQEIGSPVRCAEGVSRGALAEFTELDPKWISAEINGGRIHAPDGTFVTINEPGSGLVLERKIFDRELAAQANRAGAEVWVKARAVDLIKENSSVVGAVVRRLDGDYAVRAKVVIAADGVESQVGKWAGIDTTCRSHEVDTCAQYLMTGLKNIDPNYCNFYLGHQVAPRGYAWIFPKGHDSANIGVGIGGHIDGETAISYLNKFVEKELPGGSILAFVVGCVPASGTLPELVRDGFMVVGDAAHQNDPISGGGIINSMIAGQLAAEVAGRAIRNGDVSRSTLAEYERRWHRQVGRTFRHLRQIREGVLKFSDETLNGIARLLSQTNLEKLTLIDIFITALKNDPRLLLELRHLITMGWAQQR